METVYIQHDGRAGGELEAGSPGWGIAPDSAPREVDKIFRKRHNNRFAAVIPVADAVKRIRDSPA